MLRYLIDIFKISCSTRASVKGAVLVTQGPFNCLQENCDVFVSRSTVAGAVLVSQGPF